jgi:hypothetical protein
MVFVAGDDLARTQLFEPFARGSREQRGVVERLRALPSERRREVAIC